jgi:hypothetical protein
MSRRRGLSARLPSEDPICHPTTPAVNVHTPRPTGSPNPNYHNLEVEEQLQERRSWLSNVDLIDMNPEECLLLVFDDSSKERQYHDYIARTHSWTHDIIGLSISTGLALAFTARSTFETQPAQVLRVLVLLAITANASWLAVLLFKPAFAAKYRSPMVYILSWFIHFVLGCLPPLTYQSFRAPSTAFGAYMVGSTSHQLAPRALSPPGCIDRIGLHVTSHTSGGINNPCATRGTDQ